MTWKILSSLVLGALTGLLLLPEGTSNFLGPLSDISLAVLLFAVGFELGQDADLGRKIKNLPRISLAVPFVVALGSLLGAIFAGLAVNVPMGDGALAGAGFGWYSLSAVIITQDYEVTTGALALLTNVFREVFAILLIPIVAKKVGYLPAVAPGGATAMDVTLPIIAQSTDAQTTLVAFYSGTVLSALVPIIVPVLIALLQRY
jgi:uncharacterized membrane protein YbjE (DUF340 family)